MSTENVKIRNSVKETLKFLGISPDILGYEYLKFILIDSINVGIPPHKDITLIVYPYIANNFSQTPSRIERAIRHSIRKAKNENTTLFNNLFGNFSSITNTCFLATVYEYINEEILEDSEK